MIGRYLVKRLRVHTSVRNSGSGVEETSNGFGPWLYFWLKLATYNLFQISLADKGDNKDRSNVGSGFNR